MVFGGSIFIANITFVRLIKTYLVVISRDNTFKNKTATDNDYFFCFSCIHVKELSSILMRMVQLTIQDSKSMYYTKQGVIFIKELQVGPNRELI